MTDMTDLREFMRHVPQPVTVVTTFYEGQPHGMTVSSFTSVSLEPPTVLIALEKTTKTCVNVLKSGRFCVNLLSEKQGWVSDVFAYSPHEERFSKVKYELEDGFPVLKDVLGVLFCEVSGQVDSSTHLIIMGRVEGVKIFSEQLPLIYHMRRYGRPAALTV